MDNKKIKQTVFMKQLIRDTAILTGVPQEVARPIIYCFIVALREHLKEGSEVQIFQLGTFRHKVYMGPGKFKDTLCHRIKFKPSRTFKRVVSGVSRGPE